ncbi:DUF1648 domain-containing protein [Priestia endophytica]|uniref:DUF1648 domain-containing protein n=1 Tax=Priestia endophytica TaxID=135735 RepID=UPI00124E5B04|nr:DUF1648 domain-containing protein [Priestia endophytica]KAB2495307.1 DUF1648 domain-containing protein [Priestia endophytica]
MHSSNRPLLHIPRTKREKIWNAVGILFYVGSILFLLFSWYDIPTKVPAHYNIAGEVNRWGSKWELLLLPGISTFLLILMTLLEKFPNVHNYPARFNENNAAQFYLNSRKLVNMLKNICLILFFLIVFESVSISLGWEFDIGIWFLPFMLISTLLPIVISLLERRHIK